MTPNCRPVTSPIICVVLNTVSAYSLVVAKTPLGAGDAPDPFHRGCRAYRWLLEPTRPVLWLHGHTPLASVPWRVTCGTTMLVNVTGAVLVELVASVPWRSTEA